MDVSGIALTFSYFGTANAWLFFVFIVFIHIERIVSK